MLPVTECREGAGSSDISVYYLVVDPSIASLIVGVITLFGVLVTTWCNNSGADKRRREDQIAEDKRRKLEESQQERIRLEQLRQEDLTRQRRAVANCIDSIFMAARNFDTSLDKVQDGDILYTHEGFLFQRAKLLLHFYNEAAAKLNLCDLEVTHPGVSRQITKVWSYIVDQQNLIRDAKEKSPDDTWLRMIENKGALEDPLLKEIRQLTTIARIALLPFPPQMDYRSTEPPEETENIEDD